MKILIITGGYQETGGGVGIVVDNLAKELVKRGHTCTILTEKLPQLQKYTSLPGVDIVTIDTSAKWSYGFSFQLPIVLPNLIDKHDIIHIHGFHSLLSIESAFFIRMNGHPYFFSPHYHANGHRLTTALFFNYYRLFGRRTFQWAKKIICVSEYEKSLIHNDFPNSVNKIRVIPNGVDFFPPIGKIIKKPIENRPINLLYIGRLDEYKGVQFILKSMSALKQSYNLDTKLTILGRGPQKDSIAKMAIDLDIIEQINWMDNIDRVMLEDIYKSHDILLLLSRVEAYGLVVAEALSCGIPCIVNNSSALEEFTNEAGCFGVEKTLDPLSIANVIEKIAREGTTVGPLSKKVRNWVSVVRDYESVYYEEK